MRSIQAALRWSPGFAPQGQTGHSEVNMSAWGWSGGDESESLRVTTSAAVLSSAETKLVIV